MTTETVGFNHPHRSPLTRTVQHARRVWNDPLQRNSGLLFASSVTAAVTGFIFWVAAARTYPTPMVGTVTTIAAVSATLVTLGNVGLSDMVIRWLPTQPHPQRWLRRVAGVAAAGPIIASALWWLLVTRSTDTWVSTRPGWLTVTAIAVTASVGMVASFALSSVRANRWLIGHHAWSGLTQLGVAAAASGFGFAGLAAAFAVKAVANTAGVAWTAHKKVVPARPLRPAPTGSVTQFAAAGWAGSAGAAIVAAYLSVTVASQHGTETVAYFAIAWTIAETIRMWPRDATRSMFVEGASGTSVADATRAATLTVYGVLLPGAATAVLIAPWLLTPFGTAYREHSTSLLRWLIVAVTLSAGSYIAGSVLKLRGDTFGWFASSAVTVALQLAVIAVAVPRGVHTFGWAWAATGATQTIITIGFAIRPRRASRSPVPPQ